MSAQAFSYGATPEDVIRHALPGHYEMSLNRDDMLALLAALLYADSMDDPGTRDRATELRSSILETLDIEEI